MRLLLDTHALIWSLSAPKKLSKRVFARVSDTSTVVYVSAVSTWEMAIKVGLGKLTVDLDEVAQALSDAGFTELSVTIAHTQRLRELPNHHRDPFDRLLVAQALEEGLTIATSDAQFHRYAAPTYW